MDQDQLLFEQNPTPMLIYEVDTLNILKVNSAARQKYGYSNEEFTQLTIEVIRFEEDLQKLYDSLGDRKDGVGQERVVRHKRKNGDQFYAQINSYSFSYKNYKSRLVAIYDVTEEVNARIKAEKAYRELNHLIKKNPLATIKWDQNLLVMEWSAGAEKISGYTKKEMLGKSMLELDLFTHDVRSYLEKRIEQFQNQRSIEGLETQVKTKDGNTVDIRIHTSVLCDDSGNAQTLLTLLEDITETKQAERRLSRQNEIIRFINDLSTSVGSLQNFDKALEQSIEKICKFIGWPVGHVYKRASNDRFVSSDIWYFENSEQYDFFVESCNTTAYVPGKGFLGEVIEHDAPTSLKNIGEREEFIREVSDSKANLKTCFALPIKVGNETTVILEFLSEQVIQLDTLFLDMLGYLENQLGSILERIRAREKLELSERKYRRLFERANDGVFIMDQERFIDCNSRVEELFECKRKKILGSTPFKFSPEVQPDGEKSAEKGEQYIKKALAGTPQVFQWMHKTKTGKLIDTEVSLNSIELQDGTYLQAIVRDITKQKEAENALKRSEELFRNLFLRAPVAMVMVNEQNEVKMVNRKFEELFGYYENELKGRDVDKIIVPEGEYDTAPKMPEGEILSSDYIKEYTRITKEGEKIDVLVGAIPVYLEGERLAGFGIYIDISDQKNTQRQLENSLQEKEVLLKEIHHRVKNNLGIISALLKLQVFSEENEEISEILGDSLVRIKTMALVHETLYKTEDFASLKFNKYINNLVELNIELSGTRHRDVEINFDIEEIDLNINQAIPFALILNELVSNVFLFAFEGREDGVMSIQLYQKEKYVHLIVEDNGIGLPANFEEMRKESLGMTLIDQLTDQLRGELNITSNGGTRFEIVFKKESKSGSASHHFI